MICSDKKFLFVRVPKTASSTLSIALREQDFPASSGEVLSLSFGGGERRERANIDPVPVESKYIEFLNLSGAPVSNIHSSLTQWSKRQDVRNYFKFSFVRNPWDWMVSQYTFLKKIYYRRVKREKQGRPSSKDFFKQSRHLLSEKLNLFGVSFSDFRNDPDVLTFDKYIETYFSADNFNKTQSAFLKDLEGALGVDFIGRFESLQEGWDFISQKTGLKHAELKQTNSSLARGPYRDYYKSKDTKKIVTEGLSEDIEAFNYEF
tara:strand:+ start:1542 stop:2327 length:786 start_codon:yes stop_codon:yes gene_type:complete